MTKPVNKSPKKPGRPLKFKSPQEITNKASIYFADCDKNNIPYTITGLAMALGTFRETLMQYEDNHGSAYSDAIKKAKQICQHYAERRIYESKNPAGPIFALKNFGWSDRQEINQNIGLNVSFTGFKSVDNSSPKPVDKSESQKS